MLHLREPLQSHQLRHGHAAEFAHSAEVVTEEVGDHHQLRAFLFAGLQLVINTPTGEVPRSDEVQIRTSAVYSGTPIMTTISSAKAAVNGIRAIKKSGYGVRTVQEFH